MIQAYALTHQGADPLPALVKRILTSTATDIQAPAEQQGAGLLNVADAVQLARSIPGTTAVHADAGLLASVSQLDLSGLPSKTASGTISLTNTGGHPTVVIPRIRQLVQHGATSGSVTLDPSTTTTQPTFLIWSGVPEIFQSSTFKVPGGTDRLKLQAGYQFVGQSSLVHIALFGPGGTYEGYSLPQGLGDYADVEVANPRAGTWTAVFFTLWDGAGIGFGSSGAVPWTASFWRYQESGDVDPGTLFLRSGETKTLQVHLRSPSNPGDSAATLVLGRGMTIPITLRTLVKLGGSGGTFTGVLTGGNGRAEASAETNTYQFTVPAGKTDLDASLAMSTNAGGDILPGDQFDGMLVDPSGQVVAYNTNYTIGSSGPTVTPYLSLYKSNPVPGTWQLVVDWVQPLIGLQTSVPFTGSIQFNQVSVSSALPDAASATVSAATGATFDVTVHNTGVAPMLLSTDARLPVDQTYGLSDLFGSPLTESLPLSGAAGDSGNDFYVPTETASMSVGVSSTAPVTFDTSFLPGDPDISPQTGGPYVTSSLTPTSALIAYAPPIGVAPGIWNSFPAEIGPFGAGPAPSESETTSISVSTLGFDTTASSPTGDVVQNLTTGGGGFNPTEVDPGGTLVIPVTLSPTAGEVGSTVAGTLYVDDFTFGEFGGFAVVGFASLDTNDVAAIPYEYTVTA